MSAVDRLAAPFMADARVTVEPSEHRIHDGATTVRFVLVSGEAVAEVQVARIGDGLVVIAAGQVLMDRDPRGFARLRVDPSTRGAA